MRARPFPFALAALLVAGCDRPSRPTEPPRDPAAQGVADEKAAEQKLTDEATLAHLSQEVAELHVEIDQMKASREALNDDLIAARLQALEVKAAQTPTPTPTNTPVSTSSTAKPKSPHRAVSQPSATSDNKGGGR